MSDIKNIELFKKNFNRMPTLLFLILEIIPLIYLFYWVHTRINSFNKMTKYKISIAWSLTYILFLPIGLILSAIFVEDTGDNLEAAGSFIGALFVVYHLYIPFRLLKVLKKFTKENEIDFSKDNVEGILYEGLAPFFITPICGGAHIYVNYKINEVIDYIDKKNILDKEEITSNEEASSETTTGDKEEITSSEEASPGETTNDKEETVSSEEASSDNGNDSPEDKLKKLSELKEKGLIDEDDYNSKKEEILKTI